MKLIIFISFILGVMAISGVIFGPSISPVMAQSPPAAPTGVAAVNGPESGWVHVSWNSVPGSNYYRIGWIAEADLLEAGEDWLDRFAFVDVTPKTSYPITRLTPGEPYWFIVASMTERFGKAEWSLWTSLILTDVETSCPTAPSNPFTEPDPAPAGDYDADNDGLIEVSNLAQLDAIRYDLDGDGASITSTYDTAFPDAPEGMGCPSDGGCRGYELAVDLDFDTNHNGTTESGDAYWNNGAGWIPIGADFFSPFSAIFDGGGHTISNLYIDLPDISRVGLFGAARGADIVNVGMVGVEVTGDREVGGLVGSFKREVSSNVSHSYVTGNVTARQWWVGGLVGIIGEHSTISNSHATGSVTGAGGVGGLVGANFSTTIISDSHATANVTGTDLAPEGGLVGWNSGRISGSYATGNVTGRYRVGGLVGDNRETGTIVDSYATGNVTGDLKDDIHSIGSLVGRNQGEIINSFGSGNVIIK